MLFVFLLGCQQSELVVGDSERQEEVPLPEPVVVQRSAPPQFKQWNVIIVTADTLRGDMLSSFGHPHLQTPNLDNLAKRSVRFSRAYTNITTTVPAHASLFSSLYPMDHGADSNRSFVSDEVQMLPEVLRSAGWFTGAILNMPWLNPTVSNITQGIEFVNPGNLERSADQTTSLANAFLEEHGNTQKPFFLWVHYIDNHTPYKAPGKFSRMYYPSGKDPKAVHIKSLQRTWSAFPKTHQNNVHVDKWLSGITDIEYVISQYKGSVSWLDQQLKPLFQTMSQKNLWENTIFVFTSDHGESLGEHNLWFCHGGLFEPTVRIPLILYYPGVPKNLAISDPVDLVDIKPTILSLLRLPIGQELRGDDLIALINGTQISYSEVLLQHTGNSLRGLVTRHYKFITHLKNQDEYPFYPIEKGKIELYDLSSDPDELNNLAQDLPELVKQFHVRLEHYQPRRNFQHRQEGVVDPKVQDRLRALGYME